MQQDRTFTEDQRRIIRNSFLSGATDEEAEMLMAVAERMNLDPFKRQIFFVKRWDSEKSANVWAFQVSIDGLRAIAERTSKYDGQDEVEYERDEHGKLVLARVKVYRKDFGRPVVGVAYWSEFAQVKRDGSLTKMWKEKPCLMLGKCAEAQGLRKAFPEEASGLYVPEEMEREEAVEGEVMRTETGPAMSKPALPAPGKKEVLEFPGLGPQEREKVPVQAAAAAKPAARGTRGAARPSPGPAHAQQAPKPAAQASAPAEESPEVMKAASVLVDEANACESREKYQQLRGRFENLPKGPSKTLAADAMRAAHARLEEMEKRTAAATTPPAGPSATPDDEPQQEDAETPPEPGSEG